MSCFLNICVFNSHIVTSGGKKLLFIWCDLFMGRWLKWVFRRFFNAFCVKWPKTVKNFLCIQKLSPFFVHLWRPLWPPIWGSAGGRWLSYGVLLKATKCFLCFLLVTSFIGWFKVYFKQPIGLWLQKCNPHFVQFGPLFIVWFWPNLFYRVQ